jgi:hypothetical protein
MTPTRRQLLSSFASLNREVTSQRVRRPSAEQMNGLREALQDLGVLARRG